MCCQQSVYITDTAIHRTSHLRNDMLLAYVFTVLHLPPPLCRMQCLIINSIIHLVFTESHPLPCVCFKLALFRSQHHQSVIWGVLHIQLSCEAGCAIQVCIGHYHTQQRTQRTCLSQEVVTSVNDGCPGYLSFMPRAFL